MRRHLVLASLASLTMAACAFDPGGDPGPGDPVDPDGPVDPGDPGVDAATATPLPTVRCRVEGADLGKLLLIDAEPMGTYEIESWQTEPGGGLVGFTLRGPTTVHYEVRTGREKFWGQALQWTHPDLPDGDAVPISRVDLCATPTESPGD
jgi:hypothetical protein